MSSTIAHFALGAALTTLLVDYFAPRASAPRVLTVAGGAWATVPDVLVAGPIRIGLLETVAGSPLANAFWLHHALDDAAVADPVLTVAMLGFLFATTLIADRHRARLPGRADGEQLERFEGLNDGSPSPGE